MDGKGGGKYNWTSLMASDKKKLLTYLPEKLKDILRSNTADAVMQLRQVSIKPAAYADKPTGQHKRTGPFQ